MVDRRRSGSRGAASAKHPVSAALAHLVGVGTLRPDPLQQEAARALDAIALGLAAPDKRLLPGLFQPRQAVRGAYLAGDVGRGKTLLMDLVFSETAIVDKRRVHFHEFMDEVHAGIAKFRASARGRTGNADPVAAVVRPILKSTRLLCLDEFQVSDITNAMLLGRLFEKLFAGGVTLVATSNVAPDELYKDGLNRSLFLPFISLLKANCAILPLDGPADYRRFKFEGAQMFHFGAGPHVRAEMDSLWLRLTGGVPGAPAELRSLGRAIKVPLAAMGAARFAFADLCETPLGARDYLKLAHAYDTLVLDDVPQFGQLRSDAAKRFILLIDTLYDRGVKLAASFAAPLDDLAQDPRTRAEFVRCVSRLIEMQSSSYLVAPHRQAPSPG